MCHQVILLKQTLHGSIYHCKQCNCYQLIFKNIFYEFNVEELKQFSIYISQLDPLYWEEFYKDCNILKKIPIATFQANLVLMINCSELEELRRLVFFKTKMPIKFLKTNEIDYSPSLN